MDEKLSISTVILTLNEEKNISKCIHSVMDLNGDVFVIDSGSTDETVSIAKSLGAKVLNHSFETHAKQFNWGLDHAGITTKWVLKLDADETITEELLKEIRNTVSSNDSKDGYIIKQKIFFMGRFIRHGGAYPFRKLMLFKSGFARAEDREMDEHVVMQKGEIGELLQDGHHYDFKSLDHYVKKHNWYASKEVNEMLKSSNETDSFNTDSKIKNKRKLKSLYQRAPIFLRARLYYFYRYYLRLGFLDGAEGKIFHFLQAYFYRFLVDSKYYESHKNSNYNRKTGPLE